MNCRPGDLAVVVGPHGDCDVGRIVLVIELGGDWSFIDGYSRPYWLISTLGQRFQFVDGAGLSDGNEYVEIPDAELRPIYPGGCADEVASDVSKPEEVTA